MFARNKPEQPPVLPGFETITRYFDRSNKVYAAKIKPGEYYVTLEDELIVTVLGSCIAACVWDSVNKIGGMNHFMLPESGGLSPSANNESARYGNFAMEFLVNNIIRNGGERRHLEVKLFGGSKVIERLSDIGKRNIEFIEQYVYSENLNVIASDMGGVHPRKVVFDPRSGMVRVKKLRSLHNETIVLRERSYMHRLESEKQESGDIELFD